MCHLSNTSAVMYIRIFSLISVFNTIHLTVSDSDQIFLFNFNQIFWFSLTEITSSRIQLTIFGLTQLLIQF